MKRRILFALVLASASCGDDAASDESNSDDSKNDAGQDAAVPEELKQARVTDGVHADQARADVLIDALCSNAPRCSQQTEAQCLTAYNDGWMNLVDNEAPEACRDAELDRIACLGEFACDAPTTKCSSFDAPVRSLCPEDAGM